MDTSFLSLGLKKIVVPLIANQIAKKYEPKSDIQMIDDRINRLDTYMERKGPSMTDNPTPIVNTHTSSYIPQSNGVATSCVACARSHLATVSASLKESLRFSRTEGIMHEEVQTRLATAEEEICALERYDWTAEKIRNSPPEHQQIINDFLPQVRELRQKISTISNNDELIECAAIAGNLHNNYRYAVLGLPQK